MLSISNTWLEVFQASPSHPLPVLLPLWRPPHICREGLKGNNLEIFIELYDLLFSFVIYFFLGAFASGERGGRGHLEGKGSDRTLGGERAVRGHSGESEVRGHSGEKGVRSTISPFCKPLCTWSQFSFKQVIKGKHPAFREVAISFQFLSIQNMRVQVSQANQSHPTS